LNSDSLGHDSNGGDSMRKPIPAVRILPMSAKEKSFRGRTVEDVQMGFFLEELPFPPKSGRYRYPTAGLNAEPGTVVLFQYEGRIIASAILNHNERYELPEDGYQGALWFDVNSIRTFAPVGRNALRKIWPEFRNFGHVKQFLNPAKYPAFEKQLVDVTAPEGLESSVPYD
jgi:hypothetical protein